ncbi:hypothetical protein, partial [Tardiphaga sp.]|uniref:hypothetical protein n=1 Tax=Tardiphaga sp. TaxID=1926292 RepID=UPI00352B584B
PPAPNHLQPSCPREEALVGYMDFAFSLLARPEVASLQRYAADERIPHEKIPGSVKFLARRLLWLIGSGGGIATCPRALQRQYRPRAGGGVRGDEITDTTIRRDIERTRT